MKQLALEKPTYPLEIGARYELEMIDGSKAFGTLKEVQGPVLWLLWCWSEPGSLVAMGCGVFGIGNIKEMRRLVQ